MRRSILHPVLALVLTVAVSGCAKDVLPTGPTPGARLNGPVEIVDTRVGIDPNSYAMITAGNRFTCVRRNSDAVFCWGQNELNQTGQQNRQDCVSNALCVVTPTAVFNQSFDTLRVKVIDAGYEHACGLDKNSVAWCWGAGHSGQRGIGGGTFGGPSGAIVVDSLTTPQSLSQTSSMRFGSIGAGGHSTCATTGKDGMFCWGVLGDTVGHRDGVASPAQVLTYSGFHSVVVGRSHACASLNIGSHRSVDCWGNNRDGQLGIDVRILPDTTIYAQPSQFGTAVSDFATQADFTCVDQLSGIVQCAGVNTYGQLGNGSTSARGNGNAYTVGGGQLLHGVTTGHTHACALDVNNAAWCWGKNDLAQLGNGIVGGKTYYTTPQPVAGGLKFRAIAAGEAHTCAIATDNAIYCWGNNRSGELGIGGSGEQKAWSPMKVVEPRR